MIAWNSEFFPIQATGYKFELGKNRTTQNTYGGMMRSVEAFSYEKIEVKVKALIDDCNGDIWQDFYYATLDNGTNEFSVNLNLGAGIETVTAVIKAGSESITFDNVRYTFKATFLVRYEINSVGLDNIVFPASLKPSRSSYSFMLGKTNVQSRKLSQFDSARDLKYSTIPFKLKFDLNNNRLNELHQFLFYGIDRGAYSFLIALDSGDGLVDHVCMLAKVAIQTNDGFKWSASMDVIAERQPSEQLYCGSIVPLYNCYDSTADINDAFTGLDTLTNTDYPAAVLVSDFT